MNRLLLPAALAFAGLLALAGCGSVSAGPSTGDLLDAPTSLNVAGRMVTAQASPVLSGDIFSVSVKLQARAQAASGGLLALNPANVYVVTADGVWSVPLTRTRQPKCAKACALAVGRGPANGLQPGQGIQVVVGLKDAQGRTFLLRDAQAKLKY